MKIISHRGNLTGTSNHENTKKAFLECFNLGIEVEADIWLKNGDYYLGHDTPSERIEKSFLTDNPVWCHAKNLAALYRMLNDNIHCFWHQTDKFTLTSKNYIWTYPNNNLTEMSVIVSNSLITEKCYGICTDFPLKMRSELI